MEIAQGNLSIIEDFYRYNDWANDRIIELCRDLTKDQLDTPRNMGFGTLRNTLFHILTAEQIWLERWQVVPWRPFPTDAMGLSINELEAQLRQISQARFQMISAERAAKWTRVVNYLDSRKNEYSNPLGVLLLHVANHSVYHRSQALNYLRQLGRTIPFGIDYIFYKVARPALKQSAASIDKMQEIGIRVNTAPGWQITWDKEMASKFLDYHDWSISRIFDSLKDASNEDLDRVFEIGQGTLRKTLMHILMVDSWWCQQWEKVADPKRLELAPDTPLSELTSIWQSIRSRRTPIVQSWNADTALHVMVAKPGGIELRVTALEGFMQVCVHGSHHLAQLVNMIKQIEKPVPPTDLVVWWRESQDSQNPKST